MEIAMEEARYEAILRIKENKNPDGGEKIRSQVAGVDVGIFHRADMAHDVDGREPPAHNAEENDEPEELLRRNLLLPTPLPHGIIPPRFYSNTSLVSAASHNSLS